jgi:hypothetical protein
MIIPRRSAIVREPGWRIGPMPDSATREGNLQVPSWFFLGRMEREDNEDWPGIPIRERRCMPDSPSEPPGYWRKPYTLRQPGQDDGMVG